MATRAAQTPRLKVIGCADARAEIRTIKQSTSTGTENRRPMSSIYWARWGLISKLLALTVRPRKPPVLVLSLPRSGSSWVGETLGKASDALYLREPVTQSDSAFYYMGTVFPLDRPDVETAYRRLADKAFMGWPVFRREIIRFPGQWMLRWRCRRRLVIKEVNPLACDWYLRRYEPLVVWLVRHPAAVALSFQSKGWLGKEPGDWAKHGEFQGKVLRAAWDAMDGCSSCTTVSYEALCADPIGGFKRLYAFAGLVWDDHIRSFIRAKTSAEDESDVWQTSRNSRLMIDAWRDQVSPEVLAALRGSYRRFNLLWYRKDEEWRPV
jgi:hypothetical protein